MEKKKSKILSILQEFDLVGLVIHEGDKAYDLLIDEISSALEKNLSEKDFSSDVETIFRENFGNHEFKNLDRNKFSNMLIKIYSIK